MERQSIIQLMAARRLFEGASSDVLGELVDHGEVVAVDKDNFLIEQGKIGEAVWIMLEGKVSIIVDGEECEALDSPGTVLGEISAVSHTAATATVKAESDIAALRISHKDFHRALATTPKLASSVLRSLTKYL